VFGRHHVRRYSSDLRNLDSLLVYLPLRLGDARLVMDRDEDDGGVVYGVGYASSREVSAPTLSHALCLLVLKIHEERAGR